MLAYFGEWEASVFQWLELIIWARLGCSVGELVTFRCPLCPFRLIYSTASFHNPIVRLNVVVRAMLTVHRLQLQTWTELAQLKVRIDISPHSRPEYLYLCFSGTFDDSECGRCCIR